MWSLFQYEQIVKVFGIQETLTARELHFLSTTILVADIFHHSSISLTT